MTGGKRHALGGTFFEPTVLANVPNDAMIFREETFGPVAPLFRFKTEDEAIALANDTEFGLAAYFYARDIGRVLRVAEALEYGMVGINTGSSRPRWRRSAASSSPGWAARARSTASRNTSRSSTWPGRDRDLIAVRKDLSSHWPRDASGGILPGSLCARSAALLQGHMIIAVLICPVSFDSITLDFSGQVLRYRREDACDRTVFAERAVGRYGRREYSFPNVSLPSWTVIAVATVARQAGLLKPVNWRTPV